ncbi:MAG: hypothetical protein FWD82_01625 [Defluviitaleaceae bacterium]|nr:hypothetical protein [Defluviitaleaceae bacterium]
MIEIKKWIETLFQKRNKNEQYQSKGFNPAPEVIGELKNSIVIKNGTNSFDGANFGVQNTYYMITDYSISSQILDSSVTSTLDAIKKLISNCKLDVALSKYQELINDYTVMSSLDKSIQSRVLLGIASIYINMSDFINAKKFIEQHKKGNLPFDDKGYSIMASYYLNQKDPNLYSELNNIANKALEHFPNSIICMCIYALVTTIVDVNFDGKQYLEGISTKLDNDEDKKLYFETLCNIFIIRMEFDSVINIYKTLEFKPSLLLHSQYINTLYTSLIYSENDNDFIRRADMDFAKLYNIWLIILKIEENLTEDEVEFFRCLIADVYLNCIVLLGKESNKAPQNLLKHALEETKDNYSFFISTLPDSDNNSKGYCTTNEKINHIESLLESKKYIEIYNYLWPAIKTDDELQRLFKYQLLRVCIEIKEENPECFIECINHFKKNETFDNYMKFIESMYIYRFESTQRALQSLDTLYLESKDPIVILDLIRFANRVGEITFAIEKLNDIKNNKAFVIGINPNDYFEQCLSLYIKSQKDTGIFNLLEGMSEYSIDCILQLRINAAKAEFIGDLPTYAATNSQLYEQTDDISYLYSACELYKALFDIQNLKDLLNLLSHSKNADEINVNILYANYYVLIGDIDKALDSAKKAKDLAIDLPTSPAHQLYWSLCLRTNDIDTWIHISEYTSKYPKHTHWVRVITALEKDENGNDIWTSEVKQIFEKLIRDYESIMQMYNKQYVYGISMMKDIMQWRYADIPFHLKILKTFSGDVEIFNIERQNNINEIAMDSLSLYFMETINCLDLLKNCNKIYIDYQTIVSFSYDLLIEEDKRIRKILNFIKTSSNVAVTFPSESGKELISKIDMTKSKTSDFLCMMNTCAIAYDNGATYVYLDMVTELLCKITNSNTISFWGFLKSGHTLGWLSNIELGNAILNISKFNFSFINIDSLDLYYSLQANDFAIDELILKLIKIEPFADTKSYLPVFIGLLQILRTDGNYEIIDKIVDAFIETLDKRHGRTRSVYGNRELHGNASFERASQMRIICESGIASICAFLFDFKSLEEIEDKIVKITSRIPKERHPSILENAKNIYSTYLEKS